MNLFDRRHFLKGAMKMNLGLPILDFSLNNHGESFLNCTQPLPVNYFSLFGGVGITTEHQGSKNLIKPKSFGKLVIDQKTLLPLIKYRLLDKVSIISNLEIPYGDSGFSSAGSFHDTHYLSNISGLNNKFAFKINKFDSPDTIFCKLGRGLGKKIVLSAQASSYEVRSLRTISYCSDRGPTYPEVDIFKKYLDLFFENKPSEKFINNFYKKKTILDQVLSDYSSFKRFLGKVDLLKIHQYFESIRSFERKLFSFDKKLLPNKSYPNLSYFKKDMKKKYYKHSSYNYEIERADLMIDLSYLSILMGKAKSVSLMITQPHSNLNAYEFIGRKTSLHHLAHLDNNKNEVEDNKAIIAWHVSLFSELSRKLDNFNLGNSTYLANSVGQLTFEGGAGRDFNNYDKESKKLHPHSGEDMVTIITGNPKKIKLGYHVDGKKLHPLSVVISLFKTSGIEVRKIGGVYSGLEDLLISS